jgi:choline dehydrogenase-like flavoprotein/protein-S-isoprenylcysteine O-methyltransferase Ste14
MNVDRIVVLVMVLLGIGAGTVLPILRAMAKTGGTGLTFQQPRRDATERAIGAIVGALGAAHLAWGPLYAWLGPTPLGVWPPSDVQFWGGVAVYLASLGLVVEAQREMGKSWRIGIEKGETKLVTSGLYAWVRNPIYVGAIGCGWAMFAMTPSWLTFAGAMGYLVFIQLQVRMEERHLLAQHGDEYRRFMESVGRFVPIPSRALGKNEKDTLGRLCEAIVPAGTRVPAAGDATAAAIEKTLSEGPVVSAVLVRSALRGIELASIVTRGARFRSLPQADREAAVARWLVSAPGVTRHALRGLVALVKTAHFDDTQVAAAIATRTYAPIAEQKPRWLAQVQSGRETAKDDTIEVDVVVVGTGAGGAPVAYELASRGHAVLMLEEGRYFGRHEFVGRASEARTRMFRDGGQTLALGNVLMPVWTGVTVGGSTTINSGTCYRTPDRILRRWQRELGLDALTAEAMRPHFERVERILGVASAHEAHLGGGARAIAPGLAQLRWKSEAIHRNAPECDGQGRCMFGCPTGAKRSMDVSYVPMALEKGAQLVTEARVVSVLVESGRAAGVVARTAGGATLTVKAKHTVLACGALMTPVLLLENGLANASGMVGKNLSVHPAAPVLALFDRPIEMQKKIPQSWAVEEFAEEGLMIEESGNPPEVAAVALPIVGQRFVEVMDQHEKLAAFGTMIEDRSRGRVTAGRGGRASIAYSMNDEDVARLAKGAAAVTEIFLASGARTVFPALRGVGEITDTAGLAALRAHRVLPGDFALSAVHPLGTACMGIDPKTSVLKPDHETHDVRDLFVIDGAAVPTALGVNPQITIMALATRAAEGLHARL